MYFTKFSLVDINLTLDGKGVLATNGVHTIMPAILNAKSDYVTQ